MKQEAMLNVMFGMQIRHPARAYMVVWRVSDMHWVAGRSDCDICEYEPSLGQQQCTSLNPCSVTEA